MSLTVILFVLFTNGQAIDVIQQPLFSMEQCELALNRLSLNKRYVDGFCVSDYANREPVIVEAGGEG